MSQPNPTLSRPAAFAVWSVVVLGAGVLAYSVWDLVAHPIGWNWLILVGLTVCTGWVVMRIPSVDISFSISDTFNIAAAVLFGPSAGAVTAALDGLVLSFQFGRTRRTAYRVLFNVATSAIAIWIAAQLFFTLGGDRIALERPGDAVRIMALLALFGAVNYAVNTGLVALAVSLERHIPILSVWREHFIGLWVTHLGGVLATVPLLMLRSFRPSLGLLEILILIVPLPVILYTTFRHALGRMQDQVSHLGQVNRVYVAVIEALASAVDAKDEVTHDHIRRVQTEAVRLARQLDVNDEDQLQAIMAASLLHDVGKLAVPEHILNKPGRLTPSEFEVMKRHAPAGADILSVIGFPYPVVPIVRHHHENWNGTGYPDGLSGEQIPIGARILSVVDCFDALTSHRPYRPRLEDAAALQILVERSGTMYDPRVVEAFLGMHSSVQAKLVASPEPAVAKMVTAPTAQASPDRRLLDLRAIHDLGRALGDNAAGRHPGEIIWTHLHARVPASTFVLYVYDEDCDALFAVHEAGDEATRFRGSRIPLGERLSGWVAATRQTIMNSDAGLDLDEASRDGNTLRSALTAAIETNGRIAGVLSVYAPVPNAFDEDHRRLVEAAAHAASTVDFSPVRPRTR